MDTAKMPSEMIPLIPAVLEWGLNDDYERERKVAYATTQELERLVASLDSDISKVLYDWIEGLESHADSSSDEYIAFTCFTMAVDSAKVKLKYRQT